MNQEGPNDPIPGGSDDPDWLYGNSGEQRGWFPKVCHFGARLAPTKSCKLFFWVEASGSKKICYLIYDIYIYTLLLAANIYSHNFEDDFKMIFLYIPIGGMY